MLSLHQIRFLQVARSMLNMFYRWGGDDPSGFDCSGVAVECLKVCGLIPLHSDYSAEALWTKFIDKETPTPDAGCLAFWFDSTGKAIHVAICLDPTYCLTADGGGSHVKTVEDAVKYNAFIKVRRIDHRKTKPQFVNPFT